MSWDKVSSQLMRDLLSVQKTWRKVPIKLCRNSARGSFQLNFCPGPDPIKHSSKEMTPRRKVDQPEKLKSVTWLILASLIGQLQHWVQCYPGILFRGSGLGTRDQFRVIASWHGILVLQCKSILTGVILDHFLLQYLRLYSLREDNNFL